MSEIIATDPSPRTYRRAARFLSSLDEDWARHIAVIGPCRHAAKPAREPYEALLRAIAYQQLHAKADRRGVESLAHAGGLVPVAVSLSLKFTRKNRSSCG